MKNYILLIVSAVAIAFTSCTSSEEIEINDTISKYQAIFKINPATVVEPFTWQAKPGELTTIDTSMKLRIRSLIYDNNGDIVTADTSFVSNYTTYVNFTTELERGTYTVIVISDIVQPNADKNHVPEYWYLSNCDKLSQTKISHAGYIGYEDEILGISSHTISVSESNNEYKIDIKPAGAVIYTYYKNIDAWTDMKRYQLNINQTVKEGVFDLNGNFNSSVENHNNEYDWRLSVVYPEYSSISSGYVISYVLPQNNLRVRFSGATYTGFNGDETGESYWFGEEQLLSAIKPGNEFVIKADFADYGNDFGVGYEDVTGKTFTKSVSSNYDYLPPLIDSESFQHLK